MHPIHDVDVTLLLALALASKRRPADLTEIVAATDLPQSAIPTEAKLVEAFSRLSSLGLISALEGRYLLTPEAEKVMAGQPRQTDLLKRTFRIKEKLAAYTPAGEHPAILLSEEAVSAAILAHRSSGKGIVGNLLIPKAKAANKRPGWRRAESGRRPEAGRGGRKP